MKRISLVISDVDGTLVTSNKTLTDRSRAAVAALGAAGIRFSIVSSRPPFGLHTLIQTLSLALPSGAFNGGALVMPDLSVAEQRLLPPGAARTMLDAYRSCDIDTVWLFTGDRWLSREGEGPYVEREAHAIQARPTLVATFDDHLNNVGKMVGVSDDFARVTACEVAARRQVGEMATIARSQSYYLDVTPPGTNKGTAVAAIARRAGVPLDEVVTIGDMDNDVAMFDVSGFSIAMGNASAAVKTAASAATSRNDEEGFAEAVERLILPHAEQTSRPIGGSSA